jgi:hypothetical protein
VFFHDLVVVQGEALWDRVKRSFSPQCTGQKLIVGPYFPPRPLKAEVQTLRKIGLVCPLSADPDLVLALVDRVMEEFPSVRIEVRLHPNRSFSRFLERRLKKCQNVAMTTSGNWKDMGYDWDIALAGNTSSHLDLICLGVPSVGVIMDRYPQDRYGFHESGLIPFIPDLQQLVDKVNRHYSSAAWPHRREEYLPSLEARVSVRKELE